MVAELQPVEFDPGRTDFKPYGLTCVHWQPSMMPRPDHHNELELNFLMSGFVTYLLGGKKVTVEAGKLSAFWAAIPHQIIDFSGVSDYFVATIPLQTFLQWRLPEAFVQPLMQGECLSEPSSASDKFDEMLFENWIADLSDPSAVKEKPVILEMQARLTRFSYNFLNCSKSQIEKSPLSFVPDAKLTKVEEMACFIARNYTQKLTVQEVAESVKLNPNYAMNLFQKTFGTTLVNYLTQLRVSHAQRLLSTSEIPITEIALESGFSSISRFNDAFYRSSGTSPSEYRKSHS